MKNSISVIPSPDKAAFSLQFVISDSPVMERLDSYVQSFVSFRVVAVCRICEPMYDGQDIVKRIMASYEKDHLSLDVSFYDNVHFEDGGCPVFSQLEIWVDIVKSLLDKYKDQDVSIGVHCVSGLGRAPVLVAVTYLVFIPHLDVLDLIAFIRSHRRGALNQVQIEWLEQEFDRKMKKRLQKKVIKTAHKSFISKIFGRRE